MANPHNLPPGNAAFGRLSAVNSPLPSRSGTPSTDHPIEFMMRQLAQARSALRLSNEDFPDLSPDAQAGTLLIEAITIVLLSQLVQSLVTVSHELSGVTQAVAIISEENENLREELHVISSQLANRVRYGADGAPENAGPRPFSPPRPAQWPGAGCLFRHSPPLSPLRPPPHPYPGRVPVKNGW